MAENIVGEQSSGLSDLGDKPNIACKGSPNLDADLSNANNFSDDLLSLHTPENANMWWYRKTTTYIRESIYDEYIMPNVGISLLILSQLFNSIMITTCKLLMTDKKFKTPIHPLQILFARMVITYACCLLYMFITKAVPDAPFGPKNMRKLLFMRGSLGFFGVFGLYFSLQYLSLSDAVAITFIIPMVTAFLAWVILHERYSLVEAGCGLISLVGVMLIAKPKFIFGESELSGDGSIESSSTEKRLLATGVGLIGVLGASSVYIILRKIGHETHPLLSVSYFALTCVIISFVALIAIPSISFAIPQTSYQWFLFIFIGGFGFLMQFSLTAGIQRVNAGKAALMSYTNMVFVIIWDLIFWAHFPGILSILGIIIIIGNAFIVIKYKPNDNNRPDIEQGTGSAPKYSAVGGRGDISLQEFIISDDDDDNDEDEYSSPHETRSWEE